MVCKINHICSIFVFKVSFEYVHEVLYLLALLIHLEEVRLEVVLARLCHVDLYPSAENNLASME